jgi:pimeloyl-ACP methyl ester carboxylesterase
VTAGLNQPFDLMGTSMGAPVAVAWAAEHPDTVRRLVLYGGWARGAQVSPPAVRDHVLGLVGAHWGLGSDVLTDIFAPDADRSMRAELARYQRACSTAATARALLALSYELDVSDRLSQVRAPTLVVHRTGDRAAPNADIAARLGIGERSAEGHVERIRLRLGFRSRAQIAAWYSEWRGSTVG